MRTELTTAGTGAYVASLLKGAWRPDPPLCDLAAHDLADVLPLVSALGAAPLAWWKLRRSPQAVELPRGFQDMFRRGAIDAVRQQRVLEKLIGRLRDEGIDPIVVKGWSIARSYPMPGLRQYGDHDLCVDPRHVHRARAVVAAWLGAGALADIHDGFAKLDESSWATLSSRAVSVDCGGVPVRVLAPEDHLRVLCRHLLYHGAARPIWLADIAVAVETRTSDFDWSRCLGPSRRVRQWVIRSLQMAHTILDMSIDGTPAAGERTPLPRWVVPSVHRSWSAVTFGLPKLGHSFDAATGVLHEIARHVPSPLQATMAVRGPINGLPRLPFQLAACLHGAMRATTDALQRYRGSSARRAKKLTSHA